jgi:hypothetical protein
VNEQAGGVNSENKKRNIAAVYVTATHPQFQSDILREAEHQLQGIDFLKISSGVYLVGVDEAYAGLHRLLNYSLTQNTNHSQSVMQVLVLECRDPIVTLLSLPEDVKQWLQVREIRVRSLSTPPVKQP